MLLIEFPRSLTNFDTRRHNQISSSRFSCRRSNEPDPCDNLVIPARSANLQTNLYTSRLCDDYDNLSRRTCDGLQDYTKETDDELSEIDKNRGKPSADELAKVYANLQQETDDELSKEPIQKLTDDELSKEIYYTSDDALSTNEIDRHRHITISHKPDTRRTIILFEELRR